MNNHPVVNGTTLVAAVVAGLLAIAGPVAAQDVSAQRPATVSVSSAGIDFRPEADYARAILTISGGGGDFRHSFAAGETPFLSVFDAEGESLADGVYQWELELMPTLGARRDLMIEATETRGETAPARTNLSGAFAVVDGFIADPELEEAVSGRSASDLAGAGSLASEPLVFGGLDETERSADDSDAVSDMCAGRASMGSASCEAGAQEALESHEEQASDPLAGGLVTPNRIGLGDSDSEVASGGLAAAEIVFTPSAESVEAPPRRSVDPEGANGRPRSEEDQR